MVQFTLATTNISLVHDSTVTSGRLLEKTIQLVTHGDSSALEQVGDLGTAPGTELEIANPLSIRAYEAAL